MHKHCFLMSGHNYIYLLLNLHACVQKYSYLTVYTGINKSGHLKIKDTCIIHTLSYSSKWCFLSGYLDNQLRTLLLLLVSIIHMFHYRA